MIMSITVVSLRMNMTAGTQEARYRFIIPLLQSDGNELTKAYPWGFDG